MEFVPKEVEDGLGVLLKERSKSSLNQKIRLEIITSIKNRYLFLKKIKGYRKIGYIFNITEEINIKPVKYFRFFEIKYERKIINKSVFPLSINNNDDPLKKKKIGINEFVFFIISTFTYQYKNIIITTTKTLLLPE